MFPEYLKLTRLYLVSLMEKCSEFYDQIQQNGPDSVDEVFDNREQVQTILNNMIDSEIYNEILDKQPSLRVITNMTLTLLNGEEERFEMSSQQLLDGKSEEDYINQANENDASDISGLAMYVTRKCQLIEMDLAFISSYCQGILQNARLNNQLSYQEYSELVNMLRQTHYDRWSDDFTQAEHCDDVQRS